MPDLSNELPRFVPQSQLPNGALPPHCPECGRRALEITIRASMKHSLCTNEAGQVCAEGFYHAIQKDVVSFRCLEESCGQQFVVERDDVLHLQLHHLELVQAAAGQTPPPLTKVIH